MNNTLTTPNKCDTNKCEDCEIKKVVIDCLKMIAGGKRKIEEAVNKK